jgi:hypothetical protein
MSDGQAAFAIDLLSMQLHDQFMRQQLGVQRNYSLLSQQYDQLVAIHNRLAADYNNLLKTANRNQEAATRNCQEAATRIAELERLLAEAEASAEHWRHEWGVLLASKYRS